MSLPDNDLLKTLADMPVPPPSAERKSATLLKANIAYREKMQAAGQRTGFIKRLLGIGPQTLESKMKMRNLMGTSALALVGILAVSVVGSQYVQKGAESSAGIAQLQSLTAASSIGAVASAPVPAEQSMLDSASIDEERSRANGESAMPTPVQNPVAAPETESDASSDGRGDPLKDFSNIIALQQQNAPAGAAALARSDEVAKSVGMMAPVPGVPASPPPYDYIQPMPQPAIIGTDSFANRPDNLAQEVAQTPVSTFSADVDTASYSTVRRMLRAGQMPPVDAVRTEEMVNYFNYNYALPEDRSKPFAPTVTVYPNPWHAGTQLLHIGISAFDLPAETRPPVNLVLLVDVSGSMDEPSKLPLVKSSFGMLLDQLKPTDTVSIVTYAGESGVALPPTKVAERERIKAIINSLGAGGGTAGAEGLSTAYELAKQNYNKEGVNRILLATDGDFNVGVSEPGGLAEYVAKQRSSGVFLSVLGYGMGNYQDTTMQALAQNGNGVAAYIDDMSEARRVLDDQVSKTLFTVAKDVKFQVEFNPAQVQSYRLLGYETRALRTQDFNNDKVDAGEVGAGSEVTAIYEITPAGAAPAADASRYSEITRSDSTNDMGREHGSEIGFLRIRYKLPNSDTSTLIERPIVNADRKELSEASADVRFATAVAGFSRLLRHSEGVSGFTYADVVKLADGARGEDKDGERIGFIDLVRTAESLSGNQPVPVEDGGVAFPPSPR